jgi:hypothetical protein
LQQRELLLQLHTQQRHHTSLGAGLLVWRRVLLHLLRLLRLLLHLLLLLLLRLLLHTALQPGWHCRQPAAHSGCAVWHVLRLLLRLLLLLLLLLRQLPALLLTAAASAATAATLVRLLLRLPLLLVLLLLCCPGCCERRRCHRCLGRTRRRQPVCVPPRRCELPAV